MNNIKKEILNKINQSSFFKFNNLSNQDQIGFNTLMFALYYNKTKQLNFTKEQFDYLFKNSDLKQVDNEGWNALIFALYYNQEEELNFTKEQFQQLFNSLLEKEKQKTFQFICEEYIKNKDDNIQKSILIMLYDLEFKPNQKIIDFLKENNYQEIIEMIEKRDLYFKLNHNLENNKINNKKILTKI
jgi:hypothetical protein